MKHSLPSTRTRTSRAVQHACGTRLRQHALYLACADGLAALRSCLETSRVTSMLAPLPAIVVAGALLLPAGQVHAQEVIDDGEQRVVSDGKRYDYDDLQVGKVKNGVLEVRRGSQVAASDRAFVGYEENAMGRIEVIGTASKLYSKHLEIAKRGTGFLNILDGGRGSASTLMLAVGQGSNATAAVAGNDSTLSVNDLAVASNGTAALMISGGAEAFVHRNAYIAEGSGKGTVTVTGANSILTVGNPLVDGGGFLYVGVGSGGDGTLTVRKGGKVEVLKDILVAPQSGAGTINIGAEEGKDAVAAGTIEARSLNLVSDDSSLVFNHTGTLDFAPEIAGDGTIIHKAGSTRLAGDSNEFTGEVHVTGGALEITNVLGNDNEAIGKLSIKDGMVRLADGGSVFSWDTMLSGGNGQLEVTGGAALIGEKISVGQNGTGALNILNGGYVQLVTGSIGEGGSSRGTVTVAGANSGLKLGEDLVGVEGSLIVGVSGDGVLTVADGGDVDASNILVAEQDFSNGVVNIGAAAGQTAVAAGELVARELIFGDGDGTLLFNHTGTLDFFPDIKGAGLIEHKAGETRLAGDSSGFTGDVQVTGGALEITNALGNGNAPSNLMEIENGTLRLTGQAQVYSGSTWIGVGAAHGGRGHRGRLEITGANAVLASSDLWVGGSGGFGTLLVSGGGAVRMGQGRIGNDPTGSSPLQRLGGTVTVTGRGSTFVGDDLFVGFAGGGALTIANNGFVNVHRDLHISSERGSRGIVNIGAEAGQAAAPAGSLLAQRLFFGLGEGALVFNHLDGGLIFTPRIEGGGTIQQVAGNTWLSSASRDFSGDLLVSGGNLTLVAALGKDRARLKTLDIEGGAGVRLGGYAGVFSETTTIGGGASSGGISRVEVNGASAALDSRYISVGDTGDAELTISQGGNVTASGGITIAKSGNSKGTLNIGAAAGNAAVVVGDLNGSNITFGDGDGTLVFNHNGAGAPGSSYFNYSSIQGEGKIRNVAGHTELLGASSGFSGTTTVENGHLKIIQTLGGDAEVEGGRLTVGGRLIGDATVRNGGELTGGGVIGGDVAIEADGVLSGRSGRTLNIKGDLTLVSGSEVDVALGAPSDDRLFKVDGDLTLDGTLNVTDGGGFGRGTYRLFDYGGNLIDNVLDIGTVPATWDHEVQTSVAQQVNLVIDDDDDDDDDDKNKNKNKNNHWDGDDDNLSGCVTRPGGSPDDCSRHNNGQIDGGNGTWTATSENWTTTDGTSNGAMSSPGFAIFQGAAGTVTVDNGLGAAGVTGMQFATNGYVVQGDPIELVSLAGETPLIRVGDGTAAGAQLTATLRADLTGGSAVTKHDLGTLVLDGNASAFGDTGIKQGAMHLIGGGTVDSTAVSIGVGAGDAGALAVEGAGSMWTSAGLDVGAGGTGELAISGGGTVSSSGGTIGSQAGASGTATVGGSGSIWGIGGGLSVGGGGSGGLTISGGGWVSASGGVTLARAAGSTGTLNIGAAAGQAATAAGTLDTDTLTFGDGNGTLVFNHTGTLDFDPAIEGTGTITHEAGSTRLTSDSSGFSGTTTVGNGELEIVRALGGDATIQAGGHLSVGGSLGGSATVHGGGILGGGGHIGGDVTIEAGGVLSGSEGQTLSVAGDFILDEEALVNPAQVEVDGNLTLDGTLQVTETGGAGPGVYQLFDYNGTIADHGLKVEAPAGAPDFTVQTAVANRVNLVSTAGETLNFWDGSDTSRHHNDAVDGGDGTWTATSQTWTDVDGAGNGAMTPKPSFAVFQATPGTVTLDDSHGTLSVTGLQFAKDGYTLQGDGLALTDGAIVRVGNGSEAGARHVAWVHSDLTGGAVTKHDRGTLMLAGNTSTFSNVGIRGGEVRLARAGTADSATVSIGVDAGDTGALTVKGARSVWTGDAFLVGAGGAGELTISGGGTVQSSAGRLAYATGASGIATVTGPGSTWANDEYLLVGADGAGELTVSRGGTVRSAEGIIGSTAGASGTVTIDGPASSWTNTGGLLVGAEGSGELTLSGGLASASSGVILAQVAGSTGVLNIGAAAGQEAKAAGTLDTGILIFGAGDGSLVFNHRSDLDFAPVLAGTGTIVHEAGNTHLTGASPGFDGTTTVRGGNLKIIRALGGDAEVQGGRLTVGGRLIGDASVRSGGELTGGGVIGGDVALESGGVLAGRTGRTLRVKGDLTLTEGARVDVALGAPDASALFGVGGDLTLDGTLDVSDAGGFGEGVYRLFDYQGELTDNGLVLGATPEGQFAVQTAVANQVNLLSTVGAGPVPSGGFAATVGRYSPALLLTPVLQFWDGSAAGNADNGAIDGGAGTWTAAGTTWTDVDGAANGAMNPSPGFAIFQGQAGTITLDAGAGALEARGLQFADDGYGLEGDSLTLTEPVSTLRVGDGTDAGAAMTATIAADLTAAGTVRKTDLGTLVLTGANTWGGMDIATGTVRLAEGGTATTGAVTVGFNPDEAGTLDIGADSSWTSSDEVQAGFGGTGTVRLHDGGTLSTTNLRLAGFDGGTGTLVVGAASGEAATAAGTLDAPRLTFGPGTGTLVFNHTETDYRFDAELLGNEAGNGTLQHLAGHTTLGGDSSGFSGTTQVAGGTLQVNGVLGGTLSVAAGGTLGGIGTVGSVDNAGTVAPGTSIGTLTIDGDYVHRAGARLLAEIEPGGTSDLLDITGSATLEGGEVYVLKAPGQYQGQTRYTLLEAAGGVSGTFDTLEQNTPFLDLALGYDAQQVFLDVTRNSTDFGIVCATGTFNQCQVGTTLDAVAEGEQAPTAELQQALAEASTLSLEQAQAAFDRLSGEAHASLSALVLEGHALHGQSVTRRLVDRREAVGMAALQGGSWARGYGQRSELGGDGNAHGADLRVHGLAVGVDAWASESWLVGASVNTMRLDADLRPGDRGRADSQNVSLYTSVQGERAYLDGVVSYAWWDNEVERAVQLGAIDARTGADYDGHRFATYLEAGYRFDLGGGQQLQPLLSVQYDKVDQVGFRESGAGDLDLIGRSHDVDRLTVGAGLRWQGQFQRGEWTLQPTAQARWLHGAGDAHAELDVALAGAPDAGFRVRGVALPENRGVLGVGLTADKDNLQLFLNYDYQHGDRGYRAHQLGAGVRWRW